MNLVMDDDVKAVAEFMQQNIETSRLVGVAKALAGIAPLLWGLYQPEEEVIALLLSQPQITGSETSRPTANE